MILTKEQKSLIKETIQAHSTFCCKDWRHQVSCAAVTLYKGQSEIKKLAAQQAVLFFLTMEGEFAVFTNEDARRIQASVRELVRRDPSLKPLIGDLTHEIR